MTPMSTQKEIARRAGVSISVVSAVINGTTHTRMSEETRAKIEAVIDEVGYVPNDAARALRRQRAGTIAVVVEKVDNPVYREMFRGIYDAAESRGWAVVLGDTIWMQSGSHFLARLLGRGSIDGILLRHDGIIDDEVMRHLRTQRTPVVTLEGHHSPDGRWLAIDDDAAGRAATAHLIGLGHREIAFVGGGPKYATSARYQGHVAQMLGSGLPARPLIATEFGYDAGARGLHAALARSPRPTAIVVNNVISGIGLLAAAHDAAVRIPDELSVIAIHDADIADNVRPRLSTVRMPMAELGRRAVLEIAAALDGQPPRPGIIAEPAPEVVARDSSAHVPS
jgi:LacI family transcriptional regulator